MAFKHFDEIDETWEKVRRAIASGELRGCEWAKCSTMRYDPTMEGPGPSTSAVICVHTKEDNIYDIGFKLIRIVKQDIRYKTNETSEKREFSFNAGKPVTVKTIFWNGGTPSHTCYGQKCWGISFKKVDTWHLNEVTAPPNCFEGIDGRWILTLEYKELTALWHYLKSIIESKEKNFGIVKMVCPPKLDRKSKTEAPVFHVFTSNKLRKSVGKKLVKLIEKDISYERKPQRGGLQGVMETLYWNQERVHEYLKAYQHVISTQATIELPFLKLVFIGAPRLGKTTMRRRLTREIDDLKSAGEAEQPSTGILECEHNVIIRNLSRTTALVTSSEWSSIKDIPEEVRMLFQFISQTYDGMSPTEEKKASLSTANTAYLHHEAPASLQSSDLQDSVKPPSRNTMSAAARDEAASSSKNDPIISDEDLKEFFSKALSTENWEEEIKYLFDNTALLSMSDAGGQPEFMEMQPAFVLGPGLYLVFCNLKHGLQDHYSISYVHSSRHSTSQADSMYTVEEMIFQALSAITCLGTVDHMTPSIDPETSIPCTSTTLPTANTTLPMTSAALPMTNAALLMTNTALPTTDAALPTTNTAQLTTNTTLPTTNATLPTTNAALPTTYTTLPMSAMPTTITQAVGLNDAVSSSGSNLTQQKSKAIIVGTHRDLVSKEKVKEFDDELQRKICATDFFKDDIVQFASKDRLLLEVEEWKKFGRFKKLLKTK